MRAPRVPRTLVTSQHQPREVEVGLEDKESLWAPFGHHPPTPTKWAQVWDGNSSDKLGHPLSWGGGQGKGQRRRLPASHWAAVYIQAMSWLLASPPAPQPGVRGGEAGWLRPGPCQRSMLWLGWIWAPKDTAGAGNSRRSLRTRCLISPSA